MHELRGQVNMKLGKWGLANQSFMLALTRYSRQATSNGKNAKEATVALVRIHAAQAELQALQTGAQSILNVDAASGDQEQVTQQPTGRERPN